jgi:hypothetical protein
LGSFRFMPVQVCLCELLGEVSLERSVAYWGYMQSELTTQNICDVKTE